MEKNKFQILLADDDATDRQLFKQAFDELNRKIILQIVNDGEQLMTYLTRKITVLPQLIFLDLNMPLKNGITCLKEIKAIENLKDIPVAIYSTSTSEKDKRETFIHGANIYIQKPDDFNILKQLLEKVITTTSLYEAPPFNKAHFLLNL